MKNFREIKTQLEEKLSICTGNAKQEFAFLCESAGKEIFAFPYGLNDVGGGLCNSLIKDGARLTETYEDISDVMGYGALQENKIQLSPEEELVYNCIKQGITLVDDIISKTNLKIFEIMPIITMLEIKGLIISSGGNEYVKTAK